MVSYMVELNGPADPIGEWSLLIFFFFFFFYIQVTPYIQLCCDRRPWQGYPTAPGTRQKPYTQTKETKRDERSHGNKKTNGNPPKLANRPTQPNLPDTNKKFRFLETQAPQALRPGCATLL